MRSILQRLRVGVSLLLCLAMLGLWIRSYVVLDTVEHHRLGQVRGLQHDDIRGIFSDGGSIGIGYVRIDHPNPQPTKHGLRYDSSHRTGGGWPARFAFLGFGWWDLRFAPRPTVGQVAAAGYRVPHALFVILLAILPALTVRRWWHTRRRHQRLARGLCVTCGYDLRANPDRCPECGSATPAAPDHRPSKLVPAA